MTLGATTINNKLTFTTASGYILFDYETSDTGEYGTEAALLKIDRGGTEKTILSRVSKEGGIALGADDTVAILAGDVKSVIKANLNLVNENVIIASESGFHAFGFPNNDTTWSNRQEFRFYTGGTDTSSNGLWIGDGGNTQFIDLDRNLKNIGTITASGKISGGEIEGTSLDINGAADIAGKLVINTNSDDILTLNQNSGTGTKWNYINFNQDGTREWFIGQDTDGNFDLYNDSIDAYAITVNLSDNSILLNDNVNVAGNLVLNSNSNVVAARKFIARDGNGVSINTIII